MSACTPYGTRSLRREVSWGSPHPHRGPARPSLLGQSRGARRLRDDRRVHPRERQPATGTALHHELKAHIPREVAFVGVYALLDSPVIPFLEKSDTFRVSSIYGWDRYA
jgi:hypothetical protein